jgi:glycosyltransferase involved in cell wall biosynthesis
MTSVRVLFVIDHLGFPGGVLHGGTTYLATVLPALLRREVEPRLLVLGPAHPAESLFTERGVPVRFLYHRRWDPRALPALLRLIRDQPIDLLHLGGMKSHLLGRLAAQRTGHPSILHQHHMLRQNLALRLAHRCLPRRNVTFVAVSRAVQQFAAETFGVAPRHVELLYNGMEVDRYATPSRPDARRRLRGELGVPVDAPLVGVFGRVCEDKGQEPLIRAVRLLRDDPPDSRLVVVGEGPRRGACEALARELGLDEAIRFVGQRDDVPDLLAAVDVVAVPSMWDEAFGYTALEASAAGRAVVAFRSGGLTEVVEHGTTGLVVARGDVVGLAGALRRLLSDAPLREAMGERGRRKACRFTVAAHVEQLVRIYGSSLRGGLDGPRPV